MTVTLTVEPRDDACLAYANTLSWRGRAAPLEELGDVGDLVRWAAGSAGLGAKVVGALESWARCASGGGGRAFCRGDCAARGDLSDLPCPGLRRGGRGPGSRGAEPCPGRGSPASSGRPDMCWFWLANRAAQEPRRRCCWRRCCGRRATFWPATGAGAFACAPMSNACGCSSTRARPAPGAGATWPLAAIAPRRAATIGGPGPAALQALPSAASSPEPAPAPAAGCPSRARS